MTAPDIVQFLNDREDERERWACEACSRRSEHPERGEHWQWEHVADGERPDLDADVAAEVDIINGRQDIDRWPVALRSVETYPTGSVGDLQHNVIPQMDEMGASEARLIEFHDPAWVLADVAAKRAIIAMHACVSWGPVLVSGEDWTTGNTNSGCTTCDRDPTDGLVVAGSWPCPTLLALAQLYADHADFNPAWQVEPAQTP